MKGDKSMVNLHSFKRTLFFLVFFHLVAALHVQDALLEQNLPDLLESPNVLLIQDDFEDVDVLKTSVVSDEQNATEICSISEEKIEELARAKVLNEENLYKYLAMNIEFSPVHKQARWVGYFISRERLEGEHFKRTGIAFAEDERIRCGSACDNDYKKSGYDRGHLAPARDMAFSKETLTQSFLFSNISPQKPKFNRGKWAELERFAREQAFKRETIIVITGPIFNDDKCETIGKNKVSVPHTFFKALLSYGRKRVEAIGFVMPNERLNEGLDAYACSIDHMEEIANIDVFPDLPDDIEDVVEAEYNWEFWFGDEENEEEQKDYIKEDNKKEEHIEGVSDEE